MEKAHRRSQATVHEQLVVGDAVHANGAERTEGDHRRLGS